MPPAKPSLGLLRSLTDEHVLRALMDEKRLTRAEIATRTGLSKPTISESVRRLTATGLLQDTGERTTGRGRSGSYYRLAGDVGGALVISVAPEKVVAETIDPYGGVIARSEHTLDRPARPGPVADALRTAAERAGGTGHRRVRLAVVSAADPVDRDTRRLVHLPDAPFLLGELSPVDVLAPVVDGPVLVDNDVNWAARAERAASGTTLDDFAYVHLGEGLGCAIVSDGHVLRGATGIAGEIAHLVTTGPHGRALPFTEVFRELGLRQEHTAAIDVGAVHAALAEPAGRAGATRDALATAVSGVLAAVVALCDPATIVLGGEWGCHTDVLDAVADRFRRLPRHVPLRAARLTDEPCLAGARDRALLDLRAAIVASPPRPETAPTGR